MASQIIKTYLIDGIEVDVYGCWDEETPEGEYDFYDLAAYGIDLNLGDPWYSDEPPATPTTPPSKEAVEAYLLDAVNKDWWASMKEKAAGEMAIRRMKLIAEVSDKLYEETDSWEIGTLKDFEAGERELEMDNARGRIGVHVHTLGADIAYLLAALAKGTTVEWYEPQTDDDDDMYVDIVKICRRLFPPEHSLWNHVVMATR